MSRLLPIDLCIYLPPWNKIPFLLNNEDKSFCLVPKVPKVIHIFTDGSKSNDNVGYGVLIADYNCIIHQICGRLPSYVSSYEAQAEAIKAALTYIKASSTNL